MFLRIVALFFFGCCSFTYATTCSRCPGAWMEYNGYCYRFFSAKRSWNEAQDICNTVGLRGFSYGSAYQSANLTSIHSEGEQHFLYSYWMTHREPLSRYWVWIGLYDNPRTREFRWIDGTPVDYTKWAPRRPNNSNRWKQYYGTIYATGKWADLYRSENGFICKMPLASN